MYWLASGTSYEADFDNAIMGYKNIPNGISTSWLSSTIITWMSNGDGTYNISLPIHQDIIQMYFIFISDQKVEYIAQDTSYANNYQMEYLGTETHFYKHIINVSDDEENFYFTFELVDQSSGTYTLGGIANYMYSNGFTQDYHYYPGAGCTYTNPSINNIPIGIYAPSTSTVLLICSDNQTTWTPIKVEFQRVIQLS